MKFYFSNAVVAMAFLLMQSTTLAQAPVITVSTNVLDFGCVELGLPVADEVEVTVANNSMSAINVTIGTSLEFGNSDFLDSGGQTFELDPGTMFTFPVAVQFDPLDEGISTDNLTIFVIEFPSQPVTVELIGTGGVTCVPSILMDAILEFYDNAVSEDDIQALGNANRINAMRHRIKTIDFLIQNGNISAACAVTQTAIRRSDGESGPKDFIVGTSVPELNVLLQILKTALE